MEISKFEKVNYVKLGAKQKENYNFHKVAAILAEYGFYCMWLNDDWQGADFLACHIDGEAIIKVQLKGRLTIDKKYVGKNIYVAFKDNSKWYIYPHDVIKDELLSLKIIGEESSSWNIEGAYSFPKLSKRVAQLIGKYEIISE